MKIKILICQLIIISNLIKFIELVDNLPNHFLVH